MRKPEQTGYWGITTLPREPGLRVVPHFPQGWLSERNTRVRVKTAGREEKRDAPVTCLRVTFLASDDFHALAYFARSTTLKENERLLVVYSTSLQ